jgi:hypothetical protein
LQARELGLADGRKDPPAGKVRLSFGFFQQRFHARGDAHRPPSRALSSRHFYLIGE